MARVYCFSGDSLLCRMFTFSSLSYFQSNPNTIFLLLSTRWSQFSINYLLQTETCSNLYHQSIYTDEKIKTFCSLIDIKLQDQPTFVLILQRERAELCSNVEDPCNFDISLTLMILTFFCSCPDKIIRSE